LLEFGTGQIDAATQIIGIEEEFALVGDEQAVEAIMFVIGNLLHQLKTIALLSPRTPNPPTGNTVFSVSRRCIDKSFFKIRNISE